MKSTNRVPQLLKELYGQGQEQTNLLGKIAQNTEALLTKNYATGGNRSELASVAIGALLHKILGESKSTSTRSRITNNYVTNNYNTSGALPVLADKDKAFTEIQRRAREHREGRVGGINDEPGLPKPMNLQDVKYRQSAMGELPPPSVKSKPIISDVEAATNYSAQKDSFHLHHELPKNMAGRGIKAQPEQMSPRREQQVREHIEKNSYTDYLGRSRRDYHGDKAHENKALKRAGIAGASALAVGQALLDVAMPGEGFIGSNQQGYNKMIQSGAESQKDLSTWLIYAPISGVSSLIGGLTKGVF